MKFFFSLVILVALCHHSGISQTDIVEETLQDIQLQEDTLYSVFSWITENIAYDNRKLKRLEEQVSNNSKGKSEFDSEAEKRSYMLTQVLNDKKGVCDDYTLLFDTLLTRLGYESVVIEGYTKDSDGRLNRNIGHSWTAVKTKGEWLLFDPTWAAGYTDDKGRYVKKYNPKWYAISPHEMLQTHMPYDPLWQLVDNPVRYRTFEQEASFITDGGHFNYDSIIIASKSMTRPETIEAELMRSEAMGDAMYLVNRWRKSQRSWLEYYSNTVKVDNINNANEMAGKAIDHFNNYMKAKSKRFKGEKWSLETAVENLNKAHELLTKASSIFKNTEVSGREAKISLNQSARQTDKILSHIEREFKFLDTLK